MTALLAIAWAALVLLAMAGIYVTWGNAQLVAMFPEGRRWWMPWARLASLAAFSAVILCHPFGGAA